MNIMYSTESRPSPSPTQQINIFNGRGWEDDCDDADEDDYVDMAPVKPSPARASSHSKPGRLLSLKQELPEVVVRPASPHGSFPSNLSVSDLQSSSDSDSDSESDSDYDDSLTRNLPPKAATEGLYKSNSRTSIPSPEGVVLSPPPLPQRKSTNAGQAARMYLQQTAKAPDSPKSSGLQRSSSRVGTRGVQSRVIRSRAQVAARSYSTDELDSGAGEGFEDDAKITRARLKSRTLDRSLSGLKPSSCEGIPNAVGNDTEPRDEEKRKSRDGAAVISLISDRRRKSQSLDGKYLQYLDGISKHASAPNSPKTSMSKKEKKKEAKAKKQSKKVKSETANDIDEEEEYRRYTQAMTSRTNRSACSSSSPDLSLQVDENIGQNLADFVKERTKLQKAKKSPGLVSRFSMRKSKTSGKFDAVDSPLSNQEMNKENTDVQSDKSNSLKKEKRKSWRIKSGFSIKTRPKERTNSDPTTPPKSPPLDESSLPDDTNKKPQAKGSPQIKQTLGINGSNSPNLKIRNSVIEANRLHRSSSMDPDDPDLLHSPKIMNPAAGRSLTLDNRRSSTETYQSNGALTHAKLKQISSLNSENYNSNSDLSNLDDEYQPGSRSGTLTRLLGRKPKSKTDGIDYDETELGYGSLGRKKTKKAKYATLGSPMMARRGKEQSRESLADLLTPIDPAFMFIASKKFVRGFRVTLEDDENEEFEDSELNEIGLTFESAGVNKYATITGTKSIGYWNHDTMRLKKQDSDTTVISRIGVTESPPAIHRRNKSLPLVDVPSKSKVGKGKGGVAHRNAQRSMSSSPANHLSFGDLLTESDAMYGGTDRRAPSPLRSRKLHVIEPLLEEPSAKILAAAKTLYRCLIGTSTDLLRTHYIDEEKDSFFETTLPEGDVVPSYEDSMLGCELVTWLVDQMPIGGQESAEATAEKRRAACGMLQALLEEGALSHVRREHHFQDSYLLYQFHENVQTLDQSCLQNGRPMSEESTMSSNYNSEGRSMTSVDTNEIDEVSLRSSRASSIQSRQAVISDNMVPSIVDEQELKEMLSVLQNVAPDAMFRMVLRKLPDERTPEELMMIYEEILHIKALSHLSDSVKRELAGVLKFEFHRKSRKTLFSQGDEGRSWYIIIKGSVDVDIQGQGVVCTLHEGDDFGNLAIINDAPRAATIVLAEDNCQLLRVDKHDFVRILKDVEANTVRLKEHDKDVLVLQKIHARSSSSSPGRQEKYLNNNTKPDHRVVVAATPTRHHHRYAISAGTPTKIVEHIVKSLKPWSTAKQCDEAMEDLILMYQVFMSTQDICKCLMNLYHSEKTEQIDATKSIKRKVVYFVVRWSHIATHIFYDQPAIGPFLKELKQAVQDDEKVYPTLREDLARIFVSETPTDATPNRGWITVDSTTINRFPSSDIPRPPHQAIKANDDVMLKVYNVNGTYTTVKLPVLSTVSEIISAVAEKQGRDSEELQLIQVQSDGDMYGLPKTMTSAATSLGVNSRLFAYTAEEKDSISPLVEQRIVPSNSGTVLELVGSQEIAEHITQFDSELVNSIHVMEFVHKVFGSHKFHSVTSNIDVFAKRFNQLAYWAPTEICACNNVNKRVHLLRKFIKIAQHLKELQNMNAFMAVMIGLGNQAISRLHATWDKLPTKYKKLMSEFEAVLDPSRNHRAYRLHVTTLRPPMIPYLPLLMKDMTFQHEGNDSKRNGLINFEKMHMMSNSIRSVVHACCKPYEMTNAVMSSKSFDETRQYTRNFEVITDQKLLNSLSGKIEAKR